VKVRFYQTLSGARPVEKYLAGLPVDERAKILAAVEDICKFGPENSAFVFKHLEG